MVSIPSQDMLASVRSQLIKSRGRLRQIAHASGVSYDTVLRIMRGTVDPGYSKVKALHKHLSPVEDQREVA